MPLISHIDDTAAGHSCSSTHNSRPFLQVAFKWQGDRDCTAMFVAGPEDDHQIYVANGPTITGLKRKACALFDRQLTRPFSNMPDLQLRSSSMTSCSRTPSSPSRRWSDVTRPWASPQRLRQSNLLFAWYACDVQPSSVLLL